MTLKEETKKEVKLDNNKLTIDLDGKELIFETGKIARQANGSVLLHCGETTLLSSACKSDTASEEIDFFPLRVDYQEKFSSVGRTLGGFIKREGRPTKVEILTSRFTDRTIRPLFPEGYYNEVQILSYVYSYDGLHTPDVLAICAASAALVISDIPLTKPVGAVRVGFANDHYILNPNPEEMKASQLDLVISGSEDSILMIEGSCKFLTEEQILDAVDFGHKYIKKICEGLSNWQKKIGKEKDLSTVRKVPEGITEAVAERAEKKLTAALQIKGKKDREQKFSAIKETIMVELLAKEADEKGKFTKRDLNTAFKKLSANLMRQTILKKEIRVDGRALDEIRPITIDLSMLPRTHGSAIFTRGETQSIAVCTLGAESMAERYEDLHGEGESRFYLQYFFPPFSVGEVGRSGPPNRREIGHGKLAEKALAAILPKQTDFPYIIRMESNITESNGSSSMASVCGCCLALMNAGVPIKRPVAGIAMGLVLEGDEFKVLSDILGVEDALGDMDFKITGDNEGITAFQMDIKVDGITHEIMGKALAQAKKGRKHILGEMLKACPSSREELSVYAPQITSVQINPSKIGLLIGPGGKQIKAIIEETKAEVNINDDGLVSIAAKSSESMEHAKAMIHNIVADVEIGKTYHGVITGIKPFGLFVKIFSKEGLCHISEISHSRIDDLEKVFKMGDKMDVKVIDVNDRGQIKLSHKVLLEK